MSNIREFLIRTPERAVAVIRGNLRDAVIEIHRSLMSLPLDAVVFYHQEVRWRYGPYPLIWRQIADGLGRWFTNTAAPSKLATPTKSGLCCTSAVSICRSASSAWRSVLSMMSPTRPL